eukprot:TRINITY_DN2519_c0_g2_i1.p1 TRINITY_DN2519_c0_g2~~TRINITY_DN2519_c0_g2_i1.p1  ORF type:complete len:801 (+),score=205.93 TRINITY_DN2519_c0_g2_i1:33-2405(+)
MPAGASWPPSPCGPCKSLGSVPGVPTATAAAAARRAGSPMHCQRAGSCTPSSRGAGSRKESPARRQVQHDLMQKLRAMDLALEQIERAEAPAALQSSLVEESSGSGSKENQDPLVRSGASQQSRCRPQSAGAAVSLASLAEQGQGALQRMEALEEQLRAHLAAELAALRQNEEEKRKNSLQKLTDFELELTEALEDRLKEVDSLLERKLVEASDVAQQRLASLEALSREDRDRVSVLEGDLSSRLRDLSGRLQDLDAAMHSERSQAAEESSRVSGELQRRVTELESNMTADRVRISETGQSCSEALQIMKEQLDTFRLRIHHLQEEGGSAQETLASCRSRVQQLQDDRDEASEQLSSIRLRLQQMQDEAGSTSADAERRAQRLEDLVNSRVRDAESRILAPAEADRRLHRLEDTLASRLREAEDGLLASQRSLDGQLQELRRSLEDVRRRVTQTAEQPQLDELQRNLEAKISSAHDRTDSLELRFAQETKQAVHAAIAEAEKRWSIAGETAALSHVDGLRAELDARFEQLDMRLEQESQRAALALLDRQQHLGDEDQRTLADQLDAVSERQRMQGEVVQELLACAARRADEAGFSHCSFAEEVERLGGRLDSLASRVTIAEEAAASAKACCDETVANCAQQAARAAEQALAAAAKAPSCGEELRSPAGPPAGSSAPSQEFHKLEARLEVSESRQRELRSRFEELESKTAAGNRGSAWCGNDSSEPPWVRPLRKLECELKGLLAAQVEDSTSALRSVAQMVEDVMVRPSLPPSCAPSPWRGGRRPSGEWRV